jgi:N utilization substance protein B
MSKQKSIMRHKARELALQAIYQWQFTQEASIEIEQQFHEDNDMSKVDTEYFTELLHQIPKSVGKMDAYIESVIDRPFNELDPVELAILRIAIYELIYRQDVPYKVIINEALQITKKFGAQESFKYVNGVLDRLAKDLRVLEVNLGTEKE